MAEITPVQPVLVSKEDAINPDDWKNFATYMVYAEINGKKTQISLPKLIGTKDFQGLDPVMQRRVLMMVLENQDIGIGLGGTSRTYKQQLALFKKRYEPIGTDFDWQANYEKIRQGGKFKEWDGQWWRLKPGEAEAATPGNSYHGVGLAVDFVFKNAKARDWLLGNAQRFGLRNVPSSNESWHYQLAGLPDSLRMTKTLMDKYNWNPVETALPQSVLQYVNNNVTANAPFRTADKTFLDLAMADISRPANANVDTASNQGGVRRLQSNDGMTMAFDRTQLPPKPTAPPKSGYEYAYNYELGKWDEVKSGSLALTKPPYVQTATTQTSTSGGLTSAGSVVTTSPGPRTAAGRGEAGIPATKQTTPDNTKKKINPPVSKIDWEGIAKLFTVDPLQAAKEIYGSLMGIVDVNDEIKQLLLDAYNNKWEAPRFKAAIMASQWWQTNGASAREFDVREKQDPITVRQEISAKARQIADAALSKGIRLGQSALDDLARNAIRLNWDEITLSNALGAAMAKQQGASGFANTYLGVTARQTASQYGIRLSDDAYNNWVTRIISGEESDQTYKDYLRNTAKVLYPALSEGIDRGLTFTDLTDPYRSQAARLLELPETAIDFTDPKWSAAFTARDPSGKQNMMTYGEWSDYLRRSPQFGWDYTDNAKEQVYSIASNIGRMFGVNA